MAVSPGTAPEDIMLRVHALLYLLTMGSLIPTAPPPAQAGDGVARADAIVAEWVAAERVPGAVLLIARDGDVLFEKAYGQAQLYGYDEGQYGASAAGEHRADALRRLPDAVPMRANTVFDLASLTKVMATTFAVMLLVDDGRIDLNAPVQRYLPDFGAPAALGTPSSRAAGSEFAAATPAGNTAKATITVRQLLTHRSGLSQWQPIYYAAENADAAYRFIRDFPLGWQPGTERHYSDLGFMLLGMLVERVSGTGLGELLHERLYGPLGLTATRFRPDSPRPRAFAATSHGNPFEHRMVHDPDFGYRIDIDPDSWDGWRRHTLVGEVNDGNAFHAFGGEAGHAGLFSTARELQVLVQLVLNRGEYGGRRYLSAAVVDRFLAPTGDGQALGWQVPDHLPAGSFQHTGFTGTYVAGLPAAGTAIVLLINRQNVGVNDEGQYPDVGELQRGVTRAVLETGRPADSKDATARGSNQLSYEPVRGEAPDLVKRSRLLEQMRGPRHDLDARRHAHARPSLDRASRTNPEGSVGFPPTALSALFRFCAGARHRSVESL
jgi:CubicO group peptidase (beta-lactamase class C family)